MRIPARWHVPAHDPERVAGLRRGLGIQAPAARVLLSRGYATPEEARRFLAPSLEDLGDPRQLAGLTAAAERLSLAIARGERILLYGDYDVDGAASVVILKKAIELAGGAASHHVPHRLKDGYGMRKEVIERAAGEGVKLVISVDTGIRAAEVVRHAAELGIDVIITDHHLPEEELPPAFAVLNPNRPDCPYPDKNLCGAGVAFKLVQALLASLGWPPERVRRTEESFLKMVALATVADVVPLTGENRILVSYGLRGFRSVRNPGLRALLEVAGFEPGECPTAGQVAFRLAPRINAAGRMADAEDVIELFLTGDPARARQLAAQLHDLNHSRQQTESEIVAQILEECERVPVTDDHAALVFSGQGWHRGVLGIVASRLVERFWRPTFVLGEDGDGQAQGSGRGVPGFHLLDSLESMKDLFSRFGGHKMAAGLALPAESVPEFRARLNAYAARLLTPEDRSPLLTLDGTIEFSEINGGSAAELFSLAPFGAGNPQPQFAVRAAEVAEEPVIVKDRHLRVALRQGGRRLVVKAWHFAERAAELRLGSRVDAAVAIEEDPYSLARGYQGWGLLLKDVRPA